VGRRESQTAILVGLRPAEKRLRAGYPGIDQWFTRARLGRSWATVVAVQSSEGDARFHEGLP
jgi:hypothetical protein